ncbi:HCNGP-domain-containing protein [Mollisia scopiformis]|uniref:HCNGP-domain-containing protein n=1 Tax=Mollisia scopiformis TaxID=149040 RepID=A0A194XQD1_MOLSC|nr:HCNGP-domain-containing protein [Mollisia scopiformis]KUJ22403.1 HCNGP-domain-containing protein [Mollisia scopiformis]
MASLVNYGSSDEDDSIQDESPLVDTMSGAVSNPDAIRDTMSNIRIDNQPNANHSNGVHSSSHRHPPLPEPDAPLLGPTIAQADVGELLEDDTTMAPQSPYSSNRALLRDLTLPTIPNYNIPSSPPGSPQESTNAKFKHFLQLKKQGVHFNEKLAKSSALKNPSLMQKLMDFSSIDEAGQYESTLSKELWNPNSFPTYAYKEELAKSQQKILKRSEEEKQRGQREAVDFVPASTTGESVSRGGTPGQSSRSGQKSAAERVMAGLDRSSLQGQGTKRKTRFD